MKMFKNLMYRQLQRSQDQLLQKMLFDEEYAKSMGRHLLHASILDWLPKGSDLKILELGCGPGKYVGMLANCGYRVVGVDPLAFPTWTQLRQRKNVELIPGVYGESLPFADNSFDAVVCLSALLYFENPDKGLEEMRRVLKPTGRLIVRTINRLNYYTQRTGERLDPVSRQLYSPDELSALVTRHGFNVQHTFTHGYWPSKWANFWWYLQCVWIPVWLQTLISEATPAQHRVNCTVVATSPE